MSFSDLQEQGQQVRTVLHRSLLFAIIADVIFGALLILFILLPTPPVQAGMVVVAAIVVTVILVIPMSLAAVTSGLLVLLLDTRLRLRAVKFVSALIVSSFTWTLLRALTLFLVTGELIDPRTDTDILAFST